MKQLTPRWIALVTITALTVYVAWLMLAPFINVLLWAVVLTVIASPVNGYLRQRIKSTNICAMLTLLFVVIVIMIPMLFVGVTIADRVGATAGSLQEGVRKVIDPHSAQMQWLQRYVDVEKLLDTQSLAERLKGWMDAIASRTVGIVGYGVVIIIQGVLVLFTSFYMLRDSGTLLKGVRDMIPLNHEQTDLMVGNVKNIIGASLKGTVLIAAIQGFLGGLGFLFLGLDAPVLWGVVMFIMSMVPVVGSSVIWIPAAIYLLASGSVVKAVIMVAWGGGVIATIDTVLRPRLVGSKTRMHELVVFFSVLGGMQLFGPLGIVMGPIVIAVALGLMRIFQQSNSEEAPAEQKYPME